MNTGIAVGGYYAGINLSHGDTLYRLPVDPVAWEPNPEPLDPNIAKMGYEEYRFVRLFQVDGGNLFDYGVWLHSSVETYADAWQIVCDGYARNAKKAHK